MEWPLPTRNWMRTGCTSGSAGARREVLEELASPRFGWSRSVGTVFTFSGIRNGGRQLGLTAAHVGRCGQSNVDRAERLSALESGTAHWAAADMVHCGFCGIVCIMPHRCPEFIALPPQRLNSISDGGPTIEQGRLEDSACAVPTYPDRGREQGALTGGRQEPGGVSCRTLCEGRHGVVARIPRWTETLLSSQLDLNADARA